MPEHPSSMESVSAPGVSSAASVTQKKQWFWGIVALVVVIDQFTKWWVRTSPGLHREVLIEGWLRLNLTSNPGMAMGISWAPTWVISLVAIIASAAIIWYTFSLLRVAPLGFMIAMGLIIGGAMGNILDRLYMGYVDGYGGVLSGHVVDFIYFNYVWPEWMPWLGGSVAFPYIFNMADVAISVAVMVLIGGAKWLLPHEVQASRAHHKADFDEQELARRQVADTGGNASAAPEPPGPDAGTQDVDEAISRQQKKAAASSAPEKERHIPPAEQENVAAPHAQDLLHTEELAAHIVEQAEKATQQTEALKRAARAHHNKKKGEAPGDAASEDKSSPRR